MEVCSGGPACLSDCPKTLARLHHFPCPDIEILHVGIDCFLPVPMGNPVKAQYLSAKGLEQLLQTVQKVRRQINPKLKIEGILLTMTDSRTNYGQQIDNLIRGAYGSRIKVFDQTIPRSVRAAEISAVGKSIFQHDPKGKVAEAYQSLTKEVLADAEKQLKRVAERGR